MTLALAQVTAGCAGPVENGWKWWLMSMERRKTDFGGSHWLVVAALLVLTACTALRFPGLPVGVGEAGLIATAATLAWRMRLQLIPSIWRYKVLLGLWGIYVLVIVGAGVVSAREGRLSTVWLHDIAALLFSFFVASLVLLLVGTSRNAMQQLVRGFVLLAFAASTLAFVLLTLDYLLSTDALSSAVNVNAWWPGRFNGWSEDPNQWGLLLLVAGMLLVLMPGRFFLPIWIALVWMLLEVRSDAALAGALTFLVIHAGIVLLRQPLQRKHAVVALLVFLASYGVFREVGDRHPPSLVLRAAGAIFGVEPTAHELTKKIDTDRMGGKLLVGGGGDKLRVRISIWQHSMEAWKASPVFGLGPGAYSGMERPFQNTESHNLPLQLLTNAGLIGLLSAIGFFLWLVWRLWRSPDAAPWIAAIAGLVGQGMGQYFMRHPVFWLLIALVVWRATCADERSWVNSGPAAEGSAGSNAASLSPVPDAAGLSES